MILNPAALVIELHRAKQLTRLLWSAVLSQYLFPPPYTKYAPQDLPPIGGGFSTAAGLNSSGHVVGWSTLEDLKTVHATLWTGGVPSDLGVLGGDAESRALGINDAGQVVGWSGTPFGDSRAVLWEPGKQPRDLLAPTGLPDAAAAYPRAGANAIDEGGQIVGWAQSASGTDLAWLYSGGGFIPLGTLGGKSAIARGIAPGGQIVVGGSTTQGEQHWHAFSYARGAINDVGALDGVYASAAAVNDRGQFTGESSSGAGMEHAVLYRDGVLLDLGTLGGNYATGLGINSAGHVVGFSWTGDQDPLPGGGSLLHPFISTGGLMYDIHDYVTGGAGWDLRRADATNDADQIVANGWLGQAYHGCLLTPEQ
ncbi:hypothetical protein [Kitasatospora sp. CB02891]|uniref:hypothetical protein n=1 Tax=Kitasatospora sp. CB02891 TaxID=2020329 RepID=UPI0018E21033|nr:hypothetical protein [Kitasatospora sp. CB02891]